MLVLQTFYEAYTKVTFLPQASSESQIQYARLQQCLRWPKCWNFPTHNKALRMKHSCLAGTFDVSNLWAEKQHQQHLKASNEKIMDVIKAMWVIDV